MTQLNSNFILTLKMFSLLNNYELENQPVLEKLNTFIAIETKSGCLEVRNLKLMTLPLKVMEK